MVECSQGKKLVCISYLSLCCSYSNKSSTSWE